MYLQWGIDTNGTMKLDRLHVGMDNEGEAGGTSYSLLRLIQPGSAQTNGTGDQNGNIHWWTGQTGNLQLPQSTMTLADFMEFINSERKVFSIAYGSEYDPSDDHYDSAEIHKSVGVDGLVFAAVGHW